MPRNWRPIPLDTPPRLDPFKDNPPRLKREIQKIADENQAGLDDVYFNRRRTRAFALVHVFPETNLNGLDRELGPEGNELLYSLEEMLILQEEEEGGAATP
jgi:hypothetical protein